MKTKAEILHMNVESRSIWEARAAKLNAIADNSSARHGRISDGLLRELNKAENELAYWTAKEKDDRRDPYL